ncbi:hypothetical protein JIN84_08420 [Luteolibacter yonseiensis]|uniref:Uncharacterized protein n=1 Tax=Luteolibacter yonseiensis TaxID=1144680 RepID=A0A934R2J6_9BACT|nr:hypothetical protein [Luteolibacter yonseiensis]MBK1815637.1 hypothetical protein [Luteolibacter yonseiensis]
MSALTHSLSTLWSRFRWEILGYLVLVGLSCISNSSESRWSGGVASLRALGLYWITFRILLSEAGFSTHGGWRTRPFSRNSIFLSQVLLLFAILLPGWIAKALTIHHLFHPTGRQWGFLLESIRTTDVVPWLVFVLALKGFELLMRFQAQERARKVIWAFMIIVLVPAFFMPAVKNDGVGRSDSRYPKNLSQGILRQLPDATDLIGRWYDSGNMDSEFPQARLRARFPLAGRRSEVFSGLRLLSLDSTVEGFRSRVTLDLAAIHRGDLQWLGQAVPVLAYSDGTYAAALSCQISTEGFGGIASELRRAVYEIEFGSPLMLPENRHASPADFPAKEVLFFVEDGDAPLMPAAPEFVPRDGGPGRLHLRTLPDTVPLDLAVRQVIDSFDTHDNVPDSEVYFSGKLPREAMATVLAYHPWSDLAWDKVIRPFLRQQATEADKPALLQRMAIDPRLVPLFIEKGWLADALPILRQRAKERLPVDAASLMLLSGENDSALVADLAALAIRLDRGVGEVAAELRRNPAFDWPAFVSAGWKSRKYGRYDREGWLYARWSAELGDSSAFRRLAEKAAGGKKWENEQLSALVDGEHQDLIGYLRENIDRLKYDAGTRKWGL